MPKCNKIKNPCKICLGPVSQKNGLQCHGACQNWVHYSCLNYTPGKIKDIKAGIITVTCPCPDCKTTLPKEYRNNEPFSCNNTQCPANHPPKCGNMACPINKGVNVDNVAIATSCALDKCGKGCKVNSHPLLIDAPEQQPIRPCAPKSHPVPISLQASSNNCLNMNACASGCASSRDIPGDYGRQDNPNIPSLGTLEQMCNTVGILTNQLNNLMAKMQNAVQERSGGQKNCSQKGPRSMCPKPCYCPGNPGCRP